MNYLELAQDIVAQAAREGGEAECVIVDGQETTIRVGGDEVQQLSQAGSKGLGVRVLLDGCQGYAYSSDFSREGVEATIRAARELAQVADQDPRRSLPDPQPISAEDLGIFDSAFSAVSMDDKIAVARAVDRAAVGYDERVIATDFCTYQDNTGSFTLANSRGFAGSYRKSLAFAYLFAVARNAEGGAFGIGVGHAVSPGRLEATSIGEEAGRNAVSILGGRQVPTQRASVVFSPQIAAELVFNLAQALLGENMQRGRSFLAGKLGEEVGNDLVNLVDDGRLYGGLATAPFDGEGVPTGATRLISEGVLEAVLHDTYSARRDGRQSTGNARRDYRNLPQLAPSNFFLQPGEQTAEEIIKSVDRGFYVISSMNSHAINPVTGDYSIAANGLWIENGEFVGPVAGMTVASTLPEMLHNLRAVGNDLRFMPLYGSIGAPTICIEGMTIGGR